jgi:hypothetical protein
VQDCQVCGRSFDPLAFQVVVPELGRGFDRIECAQNARMVALPASTVAATPLVAIIEPFAASFVPATAAGPAVRPVGIPLATLGLLAAGTVTAVFLWLRVIGAEPTSFPFSHGLVPPASHRETVQAHVYTVPPRTSTRAIRTPTERSAPEATAVLASAGGATSSRSPTAFRPPVARPIAGRPAVQTPGPRVEEPAHGSGKGHPKHGKGHYKHGETDGVHSAGHGQHGSAAKSAEHGGKGHHKGKKH